MSKFLHHDDNAAAKAIAIPRVFSENNRAKNEYQNVAKCEKIDLTRFA